MSGHFFRRHVAGSLITPASYGGLVGWWDAAAQSHAHNAAVGASGAEWIGNVGGNLTQGTSGKRPLMKISFGKRAVLFDGSDDELEMPSLSLAAGNATLIVVYSNLWTLSGGYIMLGQPSPVRAFGVNYLSGGPITQLFIADSTIAAQSSSNLSVGDTKLVAYTRSSSEEIFYDNNTVLDTFSRATGSLAFTRVGIADAGSDFFYGNIAEIVIFDQRRNATEMTDLYNKYFKPRWTLP